MDSKTNWGSAPNACQEAKTLLDSGQQIAFTVYSCPKCSDRFGVGRGVFGGHATEENLEALRQNPNYGAECELYKHLKGYPHQQPSEPIHKIFTSGPGYERLSDEMSGEVLRFGKATTQPQNSKGPSGVKVASHAKIKAMETEGSNPETVALLRKTRDWKQGRGEKPALVGLLSALAEDFGDEYYDQPIVFETRLCALFRCRECNEDAALLIF
jgi:hypothetical protein